MRVDPPRQEKAKRGLFAAMLVVLWLLFWNIDGLNAQSRHSDRGPVMLETFQGDTNAVGSILKLDTMVGYRFTRHFEADAGLPFYFVHASADSEAAGATSGNGIGNAYLKLRFSASNPSATFISSITGWAPTGDVDRGFSTGRVTVNWNNYLGLNAGAFTPFVNVGLANSISDTRFFIRPFSSLGKVARFEGGTDFQLMHSVSVGASAYADEPFGEQKIYSKVVTRGPASASGQGMGMGLGRGNKRGVFQDQSVTIGSSDLVRDDGGSVWLDINPPGIVSFEVGYSRSLEYDLNSAFFSVWFDIGHWIRTAH